MRCHYETPFGMFTLELYDGFVTIASFEHLSKSIIKLNQRNLVCPNSYAIPLRYLLNPRVRRFN